MEKLEPMVEEQEWLLSALITKMSEFEDDKNSYKLFTSEDIKIIKIQAIVKVMDDYYRLYTARFVKSISRMDIQFTIINEDMISFINNN